MNINLYPLNGLLAALPINGLDTNPITVLTGLLVSSLPCLIFIVAVGLIVFFVYYSYRRENQRTADLQRVAEEMGFAFSRGDNTLLSELGGVDLFSRGRSRRVFNLLRGTIRRQPVSVFDYSYVTGSGKHRHTWRHSVACFQLDGTSLPAFSLRPEGIFAKIGGMFGYQDIDFTHNPTFSKQYLLRGQDESAIRALFRDDVLDFYAAQPGLSTEVNGNYLVFYRHASRVEPSTIRSFIEEGLRVLEFFQPAHDDF